MNQELLAAELGVLMATDRPLRASEERRRQWLVRELAERERDDGRAELRALRSIWAARETPQSQEENTDECV